MATATFRPGFTLKNGYWIRTGAEKQGVTPEMLAGQARQNTPGMNAVAQYNAARPAFSGDIHTPAGQAYANQGTQNINALLARQTVPGFTPVAQPAPPPAFSATPANARMSVGGINGAPVTSIDGKPVGNALMQRAPVAGGYQQGQQTNFNTTGQPPPGPDSYLGGSARFDEATGKYRNPQASTVAPPGSVGKFTVNPGQNVNPAAANPAVQNNLANLPPGFDVRLGSNDPNVNHQVYGTDYFPSASGNNQFGNFISSQGWAGFIPRNAQEFAQLTPQQQGQYRTLLAQWHQQTIASNPPPPPTPPTPGPTAPPPGGPSIPPGGINNPMAPGSMIDPRLYQDPTKYSAGNQFEQGLPPLQVRSSIQDIITSPEFQTEQADLNRLLERRLGAQGRSNSTFGFNTIRDANTRLLGQEYQRMSDENYNRNLQLNNLLYNRRTGLEEQQYGRAFTKEEQQYTRALNEEQKQYSRALGVDERDYSRALQLAELSLRAAGMSSGAGAADQLAQIILADSLRQGNLGITAGNVQGNLSGSLGNLPTDWLSIYNQQIGGNAGRIPGAATNPNVPYDPNFGVPGTSGNYRDFFSS